jgi:RNA polymerase-binding transcription factor DksA
MTKQEMSNYRDRLRALAQRLGRTMAGLEEGVRQPTSGQSTGGLSNAPLHLGDVGTDAFHQELDATLLENEAFIRDEVTAALERVRRGTYGRCENCGREIMRERLDALPYVRHCTPCASKLQSGRAVNLNDGRPEGWLGAPGHEVRSRSGVPERMVGYDLGKDSDDVQAAGAPGGGSARGGLAGTNIGGGSPRGAKLERTMGSGRHDSQDPSDESEEDSPNAYSGRSSGAVGGTPANKRASGGQVNPRRTSGVTRAGKPKKRRTR